MQLRYANPDLFNYLSDSVIDSIGCIKYPKQVNKQSCRLIIIPYFRLRNNKLLRGRAIEVLE